MDTDPPRLPRTVLSLNSPSQSCTTAHALTMLRSWLTLPSVITQLRNSLLNSMISPYESRDVVIMRRVGVNDHADPSPAVMRIQTAS